MPQFATHADIPGIAALYHSVWHETQSEFMPEEAVAHRTLPFFVERMNDLLLTTLIEQKNSSIVGFSAWRANLIGQVFVAPNCRGSGLAIELLIATEHEMARQGIVVAELHCIVGNHRARRFYERMDWQHFGVIQEKVAGPQNDVCVAFWCMRKSLA